MIKIISTEILSHDFSPLKKIRFDYKNSNGATEELIREIYFSLNAATALLYNLQNESVILTRQFRLATYLNKNTTGFLIEACAGHVEENEDPKEGIIREIEEETGFRLPEVKKVFEMYMTPGSVTELLHFFVAEYTPEQKVHEGGGLEQENEDIEVIELPFTEAYDKIYSGEIKDAKTALLLQYAKIHLFGK